MKRVNPYIPDDEVKKGAAYLHATPFISHKTALYPI
jgi:hypothetical protein